MWELTADNALPYLRSVGLLRSGEDARIEVLGGGVSNLVLGVVQGHSAFVVKQSRPKLRTREDWFSDIERIYREQEVMELLQPLLPPGSIPAVIFSDRENYLFAMEHAPADSRVWKSMLLAGEIDPEIGRQAGRLLGQMHEAAAGNAVFAERLADRRIFHQLRIEPFYERIRLRHPDLKEAIDPLLFQLLHHGETLCHGDFSPKNLLSSGRGLMLVDHETAHFGEPAMDLGFFFSHLLLKGIRAGDWRTFTGLILSCWTGYVQAIRYTSAEATLARSFGHMGVCLLTRVDGTSPVDYLSDDRQRASARQLGRGLLLQPPRGWEDLLGRIQ